MHRGNPPNLNVPPTQPKSIDYMKIERVLYFCLLFPAVLPKSRTPYLSLRSDKFECNTPGWNARAFFLLRIVIHTLLYECFTHDNHARGISEKGVKRDRCTLSTVVGFNWLVFIRPGGNLPDAIHCFIPHSLLLSIKSRPFPSDRANHLFYCFLAGFHDKAIDEVDWALSLELAEAARW